MRTPACILVVVAALAFSTRASADDAGDAADADGGCGLYGQTCTHPSDCCPGLTCSAPVGSTGDCLPPDAGVDASSDSEGDAFDSGAAADTSVADTSIGDTSIEDTAIARDATIPPSGDTGPTRNALLVTEGSGCACTTPGATSASDESLVVVVGLGAFVIASRRRR